MNYDCSFAEGAVPIVNHKLKKPLLEGGEKKQRPVKVWTIGFLL
jgi:hypothetical protein